MEAIVLAGGFGTRLSHVVADVPKPMAPVAGQPFLKYILDDLIEQGVTSVVLAVCHKREIIMDFFQNSYRGVPIAYSVEDKPLLTGGAIKQGLNFCSTDTVLVVNGDTFFELDYSKLLQLHQKERADITIAVKPMRDFDRYGKVEYEESGRVHAFLEKQFCENGAINGGIYLLNRSVLDMIQSNTFVFEQDIMEKQAANKKIFAFVSDGYFIDIGVPEDYYKAQRDFAHKGRLRPAAFFDRDGTIHVNFGHVYLPQNLELIPGVAETIKSYNQKDWPVIVITNQAGIAKGLYTEEAMHYFNTYLNNVLMKDHGAHIDAFYFCPHHPDFTGACNCRKPKTGMILRAQREYNVDLKNSVFYGDKESDREAAAAAGIMEFVWVTQ